MGAQPLRDENGRWLKGTPSPNPNGAAGKRHLYRKMAKGVVNDELDNIATQAYGNTREELQARLKDLSHTLSPAAYLLLTNIFEKHDLKSLEFLTDRILGKPRQQTDIGLMETETVESILSKITKSPKPEEE